MPDIEDYLDGAMEYLIDLLQDLFLGSSNNDGAEDLGEAMGQLFASPSRNSGGLMDAMLGFNDAMQSVAFGLLGFLVAYIIIKWGLGLLPQSQAIMAGFKIILSGGAIVANKEILFFLFDLSDEFATAILTVMFDQVGSDIFVALILHVLELQLAMVIPGAFLLELLSLFVAAVGAFFFLAVLVARYLFLYLIVSLFPIIIFAWAATRGKSTKISAIPSGIVGVTIPTIFLVVPLAMTVYVAGLVFTYDMAGVPDVIIEPLLAATVFYGGVIFSAKWSKVGQQAVATVSSAGKTAALIGGAAVAGAAGAGPGAKSMVGRVASTKAFGRAGRDLSMAFDDNGGAASDVAGGGQAGRSSNPAGAGSGGGLSGMSDSDFNHYADRGQNERDVKPGDPYASKGEGPANVKGPQRREAEAQKQVAEDKGRYADVSQSGVSGFISRRRAEWGSEDINQHASDRVRGDREIREGRFQEAAERIREGDSPRTNFMPDQPALTSMYPGETAPEDAPALRPGTNYRGTPPESTADGALFGGRAMGSSATTTQVSQSVHRADEEFYPMAGGLEESGLSHHDTIGEEREWRDQLDDHFTGGFNFTGGGSQKPQGYYHGGSTTGAWRSRKESTTVDRDEREKQIQSSDSISEVLTRF